MGSVDFTDYVEKVLAYMKNGSWVDVKEIEQQINLPTDKIILLLEFMEFSKFIEFDKEGERGKIGKYGELLLDIQ